MTSVNRTLYPVQTSMNLIARMQERFATLQTQLATGQKATNLAELGSERYFELSLRSRIARLEGYKNSADMVATRLDMFDTVLTRLDSLETDARSSITPSAYGSSNINFGTVPSLAKSNLDELLTLLNSDVDGRYLFGGGTTDKKPVQAVDPILDGAGGKAGFRQVAAERLMADQGDDGLGRLDLAMQGTDTVELAEDGVHPFGMKLSTLTTTSAAVTLTQPTGSPPALAIQFTAVPTEGQTITIGITMPDGTEEGVTLKAVSGTPGAGEFQIGVDADTTASNFMAALQDSLTDLGETKLVAASNYAAADNFFNGVGEDVQRVVGPDFAHATALATADPTTTVIWYSGEDSSDPRATVKAKIDDTSTIAYGAQANESGTVALVRSLAVLAIQGFSDADPTSKDRFDGVASRNYERLSESHNGEPGSIEMVAVELGNAKASVESISERQIAYKEQLTGMLADLETVQPEAVAMEILALQTRLQASYEATSLLSQLSLVNYLQ